uniref:Uncharacterized protein n=1 Tax=Clytia hemisphaerica TaxID=252671 RepID=A0A7M5XGR5_9CNID
ERLNLFKPLNILFCTDSTNGRILLQAIFLEKVLLLFQIIMTSLLRISHDDTFPKEGITINETVIKGKAEKPTRFYVPNFPGFCSSAEVKDSLLSKNIKNIAYIKQRFDKEYGIPVGG